MNTEMGAHLPEGEYAARVGILEVGRDDYVTQALTLKAGGHSTTIYGLSVEGIEQYGQALLDAAAEYRDTSPNNANIRHVTHTWTGVAAR